MSKTNKTITQKMQDLTALVAWFESDEFELEKALDKYKDAEKLAAEIEHDLSAEGQERSDRSQEEIRRLRRGSGLASLLSSIGFVALLAHPMSPWKRSDLKRAFTELYPLSSRDTLVDIGSGDGVVLREAARYGARVAGYEIHPFLVVVSWLLSSRGNDRSWRSSG